MPFEKGKIANPTGANGKKVFVDALHCLISRPWCGEVPKLDSDATVAHAMAHRLIKGAFREDWKPGESLAYAQEICDRAYGKPKQALVGGDDGDAPLFPAKVEIVLVASKREKSDAIDDQTEGPSAGH